MKQSNLSRLMDCAGSRRVLLYLSWILSALSALVALVPFWYVWRIIHAVLGSAPHFEQAEHLAVYGWMAVLFAALSFLIYFAALMCSHIAAFRVASNLRKMMMRHIAKLPLGAAEEFGSGKLRKIINESSAATETYLAHQLPDKAGAIATPCGLLLLLAAFDWRLGLLSLLLVVLGFILMMTMTGARMAKKMKEYQDALDNMANEAVEYVRGVPVVKTFGQTVFSFKKFKGSIDNYEKWVIAYTKSLRLPMMLYTTAINGVFAALIAGAFWFTRGGETAAFLTNLLFYIIITPVIALTLTKIMFMSENGMIVADALERIDGVLVLSPLPETAKPQAPRDNSVELEHVTFSYKVNSGEAGREDGLGRRVNSGKAERQGEADRPGGRLGVEGGMGRDGQNEVIHDISLRIERGQSVALVGPSGGGKSTLASLVSRFFDPQGGSVRIGGGRGRAGHSQREADGYRLLCVSEQPPDQGIHPRQCADGKAGCLRERDPDGAKGDAVRGHPGEATSGYPYCDRQGRRVSLRRGAAAHRYCPRHAEKRAGSDPG